MTDPIHEEQKCFQLRCKGKRGEYLSGSEEKFLQKFFKDFPEEYREMSKEVFEATAPFGSSQYFETLKRD